MFGANEFNVAIRITPAVHVFGEIAMPPATVHNEHAFDKCGDLNGCLNMCIFGERQVALEKDCASRGMAMRLRGKPDGKPKKKYFIPPRGLNKWFPDGRPRRFRVEKKMDSVARKQSFG